MKASVVAKIQDAPSEPGVYTFYKGREVLYIGKASNLKNRLRSYLPASGGPKITDLKTQSLHEEADNLEYTVLRSDIEALIEESRLIKLLNPKLNILWQDDKSYSYVYFSKEDFPRVFIGHQNLKPKFGKLKIGGKIGPFTDGGALRTVLKLLRRSFPYCTCLRQGYGKASLSGHTHLRDCLNAQIGKCLGICCKKGTNNDNSKTNNEVSRTNNQYKKNIRAIKAILSGKKTLKNAADEKERLALKNIAAHKDFVGVSVSEPFVNSSPIRNLFMDSLRRVECYDNSNFAGKEAVGAMTVLVRTNNKLLITNNADGWVADKSQWRKFKIKNTPTRDDPRMIEEILSRRLNHPEWPFPDLIIIDGGITQYRAAKRVLDEFHLQHQTSNIKLISYANPQRKVIGMSQAPRELQELIERAIYQTHRFVINYHRTIRARNFLP